jgi:hypothetical protein
MRDLIPSKSGLKVLRDLRNPDWRLRDDYIRTGHYFMQWRSWPDTSGYYPQPSVIQQLLSAHYLAPVMADGKETQWYALTAEGQAMIAMVPKRTLDYL